VYDHTSIASYQHLRVGNVGGEYGYWLLEGNECYSAGGFPSNPILSRSMPNNRNIEYRIGEFKKLLEYRISNLGLNLSDYRISDSEKFIGCQPLLSTHFTILYAKPHFTPTVLYAKPDKLTVLYAKPHYTLTILYAKPHYTLTILYAKPHYSLTILYAKPYYMLTILYVKGAQA
jgi:hypothetical protein